MVPLMRQPQSIRFHLAAVFLLFFSLVVVLGMFSIWRLSNFNLLSANVAQIWLPTTRALGDLNNFTSDFRAIEGSNLLSPDRAGVADTEMGSNRVCARQPRQHFHNYGEESGDWAGGENFPAHDYRR